ncbi:MAG: bifunctional adenosylcobinamide kinase/adenosylcobinamide-phosphate guanylyltransferase [Desulfarculus sp.]|nr:MAG: bifunctional adenosylcobinamide kinase/adenosylcobinamide-phosphate guanylyltransferase [Desulfarculus sp.]
MNGGPQSVLVLGGAKSGKSAYAQALAQSWGGRLVYVATGQAGDEEMAQRIARHQARRGPAWQTLEEPLALEQALRGADGPGAVLLVDCLTLWLSNLMLASGLDDAALQERFAALCGQLPSLKARTILVANEVGLGIVPENALARRFRDQAGSLNQQLAVACDRVVLITAGLPLALKGPLPLLS